MTTVSDPALDDLLDLAARGDAGALHAALSGAPIALVERLVAALAARDDGASIAAIAFGTLPKPARKTARRAVYGLRSRGVPVPGPPRVPVPIARPAPAACEASGYIGLAAPAVEIFLSLRTGSAFEAWTAVLDERERIVAGGRLKVGRSGFRSLLRLDPDMRVVDVPAGHLAGRIRGALGRLPSPHVPESARSHRSLQDLSSWLAETADAPHPALALAAATREAIDAEVARAAGDLDPRDVVCPLDEKLVRDLIESLDALETGPLVLPGHVAAQRRSAAAGEFCARKVGDDFRRGLALRHLDRALVRHGSGETAGAFADACIGETLLGDPAPPAAAAFLEAFVLAHVRRGGPDAGSGPGPGRSPGGIIVTP